MARQLITDQFRLQTVRYLKQAIQNPKDTILYVFAGRSTPYANGDVVVDPTNNIQEVQIDAHDNMIFGKRVLPEDVITMIPRHNWTANTVYTPYRDDIALEGKKYFVCVDSTTQFHVFKVLDNNNGAASTVCPLFEETSDTDEFYKTSDGYIWKYMYSIQKSTFEKFATDTFIPVVPNANVIASAVPGAIDIVDVQYGGSHYNSYLANNFIASDLRVGGARTVYGVANNASVLTGYYEGCYIYISSGTGAGQSRRIQQYQITGSQKLITIDEPFNVAPDITSTYEIAPAVVITGDGSGAVARAVVNPLNANSISRVDVVSRGQGYTWATATIVGSTDGFTNTAVVIPVMGPRLGHGYDPEAELQGASLGISVTFANTEGNTIPTTNDYRTIGILKNPQFANVTLNYSSSVGLFGVGEEIYQQSTQATGKVVATDNTTYVRISNTFGEFVTSANIVGVSSNSTALITSIENNGVSKRFDTFDQRTKFTYTSISTATFVEDEMIYQLDPALSNGIFHSIDSNYLYMTNIRGTMNTGVTTIGSNSGAFLTTLSKYTGDLVHGSGDVLYIENNDVLTRSNTQSEVVKIVLTF